LFRTAEAGIRFESFNLFNTEEKINIGNTAWCELTTRRDVHHRPRELRHRDDARALSGAANDPVLGGVPLLTAFCCCNAT
jgi:hypothetical protein